MKNPPGIAKCGDRRVSYDLPLISWCMSGGKTDLSKNIHDNEAPYRYKDHHDNGGDPACN